MADGQELTLAISGLLALSAVYVGYRLSLRTARKQRLYQIRQEAYGRMFPIIEESVYLMGQILDFQDMTFPEDEDFKGYVGRLLGPLFVLGDWDTMRDLDDIEADPKTKTGRKEFLEIARNHMATRL